MAVAAVAPVAYLALRLLIVRPIRRLRHDLQPELVNGRYPARRSVIREVDRVARAMAQRREQPASRRRTAGGSSVLFVVGLLAISVLTGAAALAGDPREATPEEIAAQDREATGLVAAALTHALEGALAGLAGQAATSTEAVDYRGIVANARAARPVFRAVTVLDGAGRTLASQGDGSARFTAVPPPGITMLTSAGPEPVLVAATPLDADRALVGEFDIRALNDRLEVAGSRVVVDRELRTVLSNAGYRAFTPLSDPAWREAATNATQVPTSLPAERTPGSVVSAQQLALRGGLAALGWTVVGERDLAEATFTQSRAGRAAVVIAAVASGLVIAILCWTYAVAVRPLGRIGSHAEAIAAVEAGGAAPQPIAAERLNEVGAIAAQLNRLMIGVSPRTADRPPEIDYPTVPIDLAPTVLILPRQRTRPAIPVRPVDLEATQPLVVVGRPDQVGAHC